jgi:hypothetical protein
MSLSSSWESSDSGHDVCGAGPDTVIQASLGFADGWTGGFAFANGWTGGLASAAIADNCGMGDHNIESGDGCHSCSAECGSIVAMPIGFWPGADAGVADGGRVLLDVGVGLACANAVARVVVIPAAEGVAMGANSGPASVAEGATAGVARPATVDGTIAICFMLKAFIAFSCFSTNSDSSFFPDLSHYTMKHHKKVSALNTWCTSAASASFCHLNNMV